MQALESQGYVTAAWVNGQIASNLSLVWSAINDLGNYVANVLTPRVDLAHSRITTVQNDIANNIRPWITAIDTDLRWVENDINNSIYPWLQAIDQDLVDLEAYVNEIIAPDLTPIENRLSDLEAVWGQEMITKIDEFDTRIIDLQTWVGTSLANLMAYVDIELEAVTDSITHIINVSLPTITLKISTLEASIANALILISERFTSAALERRAWDRFPEVVAAQWLGAYRNVFPEYKNILKLWLARILE